jgi:hypothetical protein
MGRPAGSWDGDGLTGSSRRDVVEIPNSNWKDHEEGAAPRYLHYFFSVTFFICCPQQISTWGMLGGHGHAFW